MIEHADYPVEVRWRKEKMGAVDSAEDALPSLPVASPPEFGGHPHVWSPEHLFVASVASCFMTTFVAIAEASRLAVSTLEVPAVGTIERGDDRRYRFTQIVLRPRIGLTDITDTERAQRIVRKAEEACLITRSLATEVVVEVAVEAPEGSTAGATT